MQMKNTKKKLTLLLEKWRYFMDVATAFALSGPLSVGIAAFGSAIGIGLAAGHALKNTKKKLTLLLEKWRYFMDVATAFFKK